MPDNKQRCISKVVYLNDDVGNLSNNVFSGQKSGLYNFTTNVDLSGSNITEKATLSGIALSELEKIDDFEVQSEMMAIKRFKAIASMSQKCSWQLGDRVQLEKMKDFNQKIEDFFGGNFFEIEKGLVDYKEGVLSEYKTSRQDIQKPVDAAPLFVQMVENIHDNFVNPEKYVRCHVVYYCDDANNPFPNFIEQLRQPECDAETAFYSLASQLQKHHKLAN